MIETIAIINELDEALPVVSEVDMIEHNGVS